MLPSSLGRLAVQLDDRCRFYGVLASVALHGAVATAIVWELATHAGAPVPTQPRVMMVNLRLTQDDHPPAPVERLRPADIAKPNPKAALKALGQAAAQAPTVTRASLSRPAESGGGASASTALAALRETQGASRTDYEAVLRERMRPFFIYPDVARPGRLHGTVEVHFSVARDGKLLSVSIEQGSGYAILDAAALEVIRQAQPLPVVPRDLPDPLDISLPLEYIPPTMTVGGRFAPRPGIAF